MMNFSISLAMLITHLELKFKGESMLTWTNCYLKTQQKRLVIIVNWS